MLIVKSMEYNICSWIAFRWEKPTMYRVCNLLLAFN